MARIRSLKPDFFTDEDLACVSIEARYLFEGLWCHSDRDGRLEYRPKKIKVQVFPYDNVDVDGLLAILNDPKIPHRPGKRFIEVYEVDGEKYIQILKLKKHQKFHRDEKSKNFPEPTDKHGASRVPAGCQQGASRVPAAGVTGSCELLTVNRNGFSPVSKTQKPEQPLPVLVQNVLEQIKTHYPASGIDVGIEDGQVEAILRDDISVSDHGAVVVSIKHYRAKVDAEGTPPQFIKKIVNFLRDDFWRNHIKAPQPLGPSPPDYSWREKSKQDEKTFRAEQAKGVKKASRPEALKR